MTKLMSLLRITTLTSMPSGRKLRQGDQITFEFRIENISNEILSNIFIVDEGSKTPGEQIKMLPGAKQTIRVIYLLTKEDEQSGIVRNTSILSYQLPSGEIITETLQGLNVID